MKLQWTMSHSQSLTWPFLSISADHNVGSPRSLYLKICQDVYHIVNDFHVCYWLLSYDSFKISAILAISLKHNNPDIIEKVNLDAQLGKSDHFIMEMILQNVLLTENKKPFYYNLLFWIIIKRIMNKWNYCLIRIPLKKLRIVQMSVINTTCC